MQHGIALERYLQRHIEAGLPAPPGAGPWNHVLVIPAYRESAALLDTLSALRCQQGKILVIIVLNRPDSDHNSQVNAALRSAIWALPRLPAGAAGEHGSCHCLSARGDLLLYDLEQLRGPSPANQGVGLARKAGCDLALNWMARGDITTDWICSSDADATLPPGYFERIAALTAPGSQLRPAPVAATLPFYHRPGGEAATDEATACYELRLHYYVLGLEYAGSPYAHHTLGSCLAVRALPYAQVRGFPKRAGGEDFYLLNKLAKVGPVARLAGPAIGLQSRESSRVPFGTGPAVARLADAGEPATAAVFYHPQGFEALRQLLLAVPGLYSESALPLATILASQGLCPRLGEDTATVLTGLGWESALAHCRRQAGDTAQFSRQFHQWFDGFRTLKFLHGLRAAGWADQSLSTLDSLCPQIWPGKSPDLQGRREAILLHLGWTDAASGQAASRPEDGPAAGDPAAGDPAAGDPAAGDPAHY